MNTIQIVNLDIVRNLNLYTAQIDTVQILNG